MSQEREATRSGSGCSLLSVAKIVAALAAAGLGWMNQAKIIDLLNRVVEKPPIIIHVKRSVVDRKAVARRRPPSCGTYRYRKDSTGECRDARDQ